MDKRPPKTGGAYAHYVLFVLVIVYVFNFIDRSILSVLAEEIKADLNVTDANLGFLYGTVFAVFYAVFGIPLARFADVWTRRSLIAAGLFFWSFMTAMSGTARSFLALSAYRIGVGVGEASASPAAYSMLSDYYPPRLRATVIAIYSSGVYIGGGIGVFLGGWILGAWGDLYPDTALAPLQLKGWHVAFMAVGIPGLLMALWVRTLREPTRGSSENLVTEEHPAPFNLLAIELAAMLPIANLRALKQAGASLKVNALTAAGIGSLGALLAFLTGDIAQWAALGIGAYVVFCWAQSLAVRDPATFAMIFKTRSMVYTMLAFPTIAFVTYGTGFWTVPLMLRLHDVTVFEVGTYIGLGSALGGLIGVTLGGVVADWLKARTPNGRLYIGYFAVFGSVPLVLWMIYTDLFWLACVLNVAYHIPSASWPSIPPSTAADLVMPRMRAISGAYYILMNTFIGLAIGPYAIGKLSDVYASTGMSSAQALQSGIASGLSVLLLSLLFLWLAQKYLPKDEQSRLKRAESLGENIPSTI